MAGNVPLRAWRERKLITQRELAARSGVGLATIVRIEHGEAGRISTLRRLAAGLDVSAEELQRGPHDLGATPPPA